MKAWRTAAGLRHRYRPGGPWQRLLPRVYLTSTGEPTVEQLQTAALLYAGRSSVITGPAALRRYRLRAPETRQIDVLVAAVCHCPSCAFVTIHCTCRLPDAQTRDLAIGYVTPARAVADTVLGLSTRSEVRAVVADAVQQGSSWTARCWPRPDAWWPDWALVVEIDSREWHLSPDDWEATMARGARLRAVGIRVIHVTPRQVRREPQRVLATIADALRRRERVAGIITVSATA
jgi:hypothetical protein